MKRIEMTLVEPTKKKGRHKYVGTIPIPILNTVEEFTIYIPQLISNLEGTSVGPAQKLWVSIETK